MSTSGQTTFNIAGGELLLWAFGLCGIRRTALTPEHMADARMAFNLLLSSFGNDTPNLWTVDLVTEVLVPGQATYTVEPDTIMMLDTYISTGTGDSQVDRIIWPISRTEYASMPNKNLESQPTVFWFDRQLSPQVTLWQTPDDQQVYTLKYYRATVIQDQSLSNGQNVDVPRWWLLATAFGLAELLAMSYATDRVAGLAMKAKEALLAAREADTENVPTYFLPMMSGYWPR